ncbi:MAG TPA: hypothetical protein VE011_01935 [Candidatus Dormibacteraeota bacterium]|nr:hypothetical protein [Candidatus Dormibacteraeota bacterium]
MPAIPKVNHPVLAVASAAGVGLLMVVGNTGFWPMPNLSLQFAVSQSLARVPFRDPTAHYLFFNYLEPALFGLLGGKSLIAYLVYALAVSLCFFGLFAVWFVRYHGPRVAVGEWKILPALTFPVFMLPFYWIGMDGMTLLLMLLVMITLQSRWVVLPALLLGLQHADQGMLAFAVLAGTLVLSLIVKRDRETLKPLTQTLLALAGVVAGMLILDVWFAVGNVGIAGDRSTYLQTYYQVFLGSWGQSWPVIAWSLFGIAWVLVLREARTLWPILVAGAVVFISLVIVGDQTRVGVILLFPSLFFWVMMNRAIWTRLGRLSSAAIVVAYLLIPVVVVWGRPFVGSLWRYDVSVARHVLAHGASGQQFDWTLPFHAAPSPK